MPKDALAAKHSLLEHVAYCGWMRGNNEWFIVVVAADADDGFIGVVLFGATDDVLTDTVDNFVVGCTDTVLFIFVTLAVKLLCFVVNLLLAVVFGCLLLGFEVIVKLSEVVVTDVVSRPVDDIQLVADETVERVDRAL